MNRLILRAGSHEPMWFHQHHLNVNFRDDPLRGDRVLPGHLPSNEGHHPEGQSVTGRSSGVYSKNPKGHVSFEIPQRMLTNEIHLKKTKRPYVFLSFLSSIDQSIYTFPQPSRTIRLCN